MSSHSQRSRHSGLLPENETLVLPGFVIFGTDSNYEKIIQGYYECASGCEKSIGASEPLQER